MSLSAPSSIVNTVTQGHVVNLLRGADNDPVLLRWLRSGQVVTDLDQWPEIYHAQGRIRLRDVVWMGLQALPMLPDVFPEKLLCNASHQHWHRQPQGADGTTARAKRHGRAKRKIMDAGEPGRLSRPLLGKGEVVIEVGVAGQPVVALLRRRDVGVGPEPNLASKGREFGPGTQILIMTGRADDEVRLKRPFLRFYRNVVPRPCARPANWRWYAVGTPALLPAAARFRWASPFAFRECS